VDLLSLNQIRHPLNVAAALKDGEKFILLFKLAAFAHWLSAVRVSPVQIRNEARQDARRSLSLAHSHSPLALSSPFFLD
jgi:hypothetical protein